MVLEYLPTKLGNFWCFYVGVHIPAPWFKWVMAVDYRNN